jgi:predicted nuclease of predicted toxin-antitoxin system
MGDSQSTATDEEVLARAREERRILVTLDKDFGEFVVVRGLPHAGIIRLVCFSAREHAEATMKILETHIVALEAGALITSNPKRGTPRVRPR